MIAFNSRESPANKAIRTKKQRKAHANSWRPKKKRRTAQQSSLFPHTSCATKHMGKQIHRSTTLARTHTKKVPATLVLPLGVPPQNSFKFLVILVYCRMRGRAERATADTVLRCYLVCYSSRDKRKRLVVLFSHPCDATSRFGKGRRKLGGHQSLRDGPHQGKEHEARESEQRPACGDHRLDAERAATDTVKDEQNQRLR